MNVSVKNFKTTDISVSVALFWNKEPDFKIHSIDIYPLDANSYSKKILKEKPGCALKTSLETGKYFLEIDSWFHVKCKVLPLKYLFLERLTPFQKKILLTLHEKVPRGKTISYSGLAKLAGFPGAARAVGTVMSSNPFPLVFPCHRVVRSDGSVGCLQGGKKGIPLKKALLENEGAFFK